MSWDNWLSYDTENLHKAYEMEDFNGFPEELVSSIIDLAQQIAGQKEDYEIEADMMKRIREETNTGVLSRTEFHYLLDGARMIQDYLNHPDVQRIVRLQVGVMEELWNDMFLEDFRVE